MIAKHDCLFKEREYWIDTARGIAILLVLIGHAGVSVDINRYILSFHMPLFFFLSGMVFDNEKYRKLDGRRYIQKNLKELMIPYLVFDIVILAASVVNGMIHGYEVTVINFIISMLLCRNINLVGTGLILWFFPCVFLVKIGFFYLNQYKDGKCLKKKIGLAILFVIAIMSQNLKHYVPFCLDTALMGLFFYWTGNLVKKIIDEQKEIMRGSTNKLKCLIIGSVSFVILGGVLLIDKETTYMYINSYTTFYFLLIETFLGIMGVIMFSYAFENNCLLRHLGKESKWIFCISSLIYSYMNYLIEPNTAWKIWILRVLLNIVISCSMIWICKKVIFYKK